jgi:methionyl-tRNA synthetase
MTEFVTTPIYYPNDVPHIGTLYSTVAADVCARYARVRGKDAYMLTGTDEHGKKIQNAAREDGKNPQRFVDELSEQFKVAFERLDIRFDRFIRTTDPDHVEVVQRILQRLYEQGDIYEGTYEGHYCVECEAYYKEKELEEGCCPTHEKPVEWLSEDCYYFRLSKYGDWLLDHLERNPDFVRPEPRYNEVKNIVEEGLEDLCISRSTFDWGIPVPFDDDHIAYVWFDALINYLTGAGYLHDPEVFKNRWPTATHIIGKDILRFHAVIWPAMLRAADIDPPQQVFAHGFLTVDGRKLGKSLDNVAQLDYLVENYGVDPLRYYLFRAFSFGTDGDFSQSELVERNNTELANELGNLVRRATTMIERYRDGIVPSSATLHDSERELKALVEEVVNQVSRAMEEMAFQQALEATWEFVRGLNAYLNEREPWILAEDGREQQLDTVLAFLAEGLRQVAVLTYPFIPESSEAIAQRVGLEEVPLAETLVWDDHLAGCRVEVGPVLFEPLEVAEETAPPPIDHVCSEEVHDLGIPYCVAQLNNLEIPAHNAEVETRKRRIEQRIRKQGPNWTEDIPEVQGYYELYDRIGKAPGTVSSPIDLLSKYIFESELGRLPQINALVDLYNVYALEHCLSIGAHDWEKIQEPIQFDVAQKPRSYRPVGTSTSATVEAGEYYWHDDEHVLCRLDVKQGEATKVDDRTRHVVLIVQGNSAIQAEEVRKQTEALSEEIVDLFGGALEILEETTELPQHVG